MNDYCAINYKSMNKETTERTSPQCEPQSIMRLRSRTLSNPEGVSFLLFVPDLNSVGKKSFNIQVQSWG